MVLEMLHMLSEYVWLLEYLEYCTCHIRRCLLEKNVINLINVLTLTVI